MTTESNANNSEAMTQASTQQQQEQMVAMSADADAAEARSVQARTNFNTVCQQAAAALNLNPQTPQGALLQQALQAAFQWGAEAANASDHAVQRRKEVELVGQLVAAQEAELKESRERREQAREESNKRTAILEKLANNTEQLAKKGDKFFEVLDGLVPSLVEASKSKPAVGAG